MASNPDSGLYLIGTIVKVHGTRGGFVMEVDHSINLPDKLEIVYLRYPEQQWVPYRITEWRTHPDRNRNLFFVSLEGIESRTVAGQLRGRDVMTDQEPGAVEQEKSVIGYEVIRDNISLGTVKDILVTPGYPILIIQDNDKQILIPMVEEYVTEECHETERVHVRNTQDLESLG